MKNIQNILEPPWIIVVREVLKGIPPTRPTMMETVIITRIA